MKNMALDYAVDSFRTLLGIQGRSFGSKTKSYDGISDGYEGVQWNVAVFKDRQGKARLGVNLEGMKYDGWPIARFIEYELGHRGLLALHVEKEKIHVGFERDAWQVTDRPAIEEKSIGCSGMLLDDLTDIQWKKTLEEAYACLDESNNYRGRAKQLVTLSKSGIEKEMEVSPHLTIYTWIWSSVPSDLPEAKMLMQKGFNRLLPVYEYVKSHS
ncbi:MAG: hypothetical protein HGA57_09695 [Chlorobium limicola]|nr:hypothetical protein [Chlorobium limicola]